MYKRKAFDRKALQQDNMDIKPLAQEWDLVFGVARFSNGGIDTIFNNHFEDILTARSVSYLYHSWIIVISEIQERTPPRPNN